MRLKMMGGLLILAMLLGLGHLPARAAAMTERETILGLLCGPGFHAVPEAADRIARDLPAATPADLAWDMTIVQAYANRRLRCAGGAQAYIAASRAFLDAATLTPIAAAPAAARSPFPSLRARSILGQLAAMLSLVGAPAPIDRLAAVATLRQHSDALPPGIAEAALGREHDARVRAALRDLVTLQALHAPDSHLRVAAIAALSRNTTSRVAMQLQALQADATYAADPAVAAALRKGLDHVRFWVRAGSALSLLYNGISAGSVLFMSAIGLAIIFGLMGVINLAQGELIMIGAYTTYSVQQCLHAVAPAYVALYPIIAIPVTFVVSGAIGVAIEAIVIRHLYRRPLMTLLATWGISLLLINLVRVIFGTQNIEFLTPSYLTGGIPVIGDFFVTWNHLAAIVIAVIAFIGTLLLLRLTRFGLNIRAVTQNRQMAGCVGVSTRRTDMLAFGFGAGLAGLGGLALSPIYNVNPTMGTGFIIDSFMVVVLGGVGSLAGTAIAAIGIGLVNVGIEPFYGAVAAKVIALLLIILLIQWRPEGLIAIRGRR